MVPVPATLDRCEPGDKLMHIGTLGGARFMFRAYDRLRTVDYSGTAVAAVRQ
jgi:hypothetical protein